MEWKKRGLAAALAVMLLAGGITAYAAVGTSENPLVTLSYLRETFTNEILSQTEKKLSAAQATYEAKLSEKVSSVSNQGSGGGTGAFAVVELRAGQSFTLQTGGEFMLREGETKCSGNSAFLDTTSGLAYDGSGLMENHLYLVTDSSLSFQATSAVTLLARGTYTIG